CSSPSEPPPRWGSSSGSSPLASRPSCTPCRRCASNDAPPAPTAAALRSRGPARSVVVLQLGERVSLGGRQDPSHLQQHRHPCLAEVGTGLLERIDLGQDPRVVRPIIPEQRIESGLRLVDLCVEVGERALMAGKYLLEVPHLVVAHLELLANLLLLPELAVVLSETTTGPVCVGGRR